MQFLCMFNCEKRPVLLIYSVK